MDNTLMGRITRVNDGWMKFVEVKTKTTCTMVFLLCIAFFYHLELAIAWPETIIFMLATLLVDLATTATNNYMGYKKEGEALTLKPRTGRIIIVSLFALASVLGIVLLVMTQNVLILIAGGICFLVGATYTTGPIPIAATPLGELLSGVIQGYMNAFIFALINVPVGRLIFLAVDDSFITLHLEWPWLLAFLFFGWIPTALIAGVMLANNTCDLTKDEEIGRYTLPHYIGRKGALKLYTALYVSIYVAIVVLVLMQAFSPWQLAVLLTAIPVFRNIKQFWQKQVKSENFTLTLKNLALIMLSLTVTFFISAIIIRL